MTQDRNDNVHGRLPEWETQVNALLDGELDEASTAALKQAAAEDRNLARAIIEAYELQRDMDQLGPEQAPPSLRKKLLRIPREQNSFWRPRRWVMATAMAVVPLLAITLVLLQPKQPSAAEVEQARKDLVVAFSYIDKVGNRTGGFLQSLLATELDRNVTDNISKHFPYTTPSQEEKKHET